MKITKTRLIQIIKEEFALAKVENTPQINQNMGEKDPYFDYPDDEGNMAKRQLKHINEYSGELMHMLGDNEQLEAWVQSKITKAADYISTVKHYLEYEMGRSAAKAGPCPDNPYDMDPERSHLYEEDDETT